MATIETANDLRTLGLRRDSTQVFLQPIGQESVTLGAFLRRDSFNGRPEHLVIASRASSH
jgi:hypothetical protein